MKKVMKPDREAVAKHEAALKVCPCPFHLPPDQRKNPVVCCCIENCPADGENWEGE